MSAHVVIELDTTPPVVTLGTPTRDAAGHVSYPYAISEPSLVSAEVNGAVATITATKIVTTVSLPQGGSLQVRMFVRDDVGNENVQVDGEPVPPVAGRVTKSTPGHADEDRATARRTSTGRIARVIRPFIPRGRREG